MHGVLNLYKETGKSSNYLLTQIKKKLNIKKIGHMGTLDPLACGVLPVMIGKGTKLFDYYLNKTKVYRAVFTFGKTTATLDSEGEVVEISNNIPKFDEIKKVLPSLIENEYQIPPNFSANLINGVRAYNLARKGESIQLKPKKIKIYHINLLKQINDNSFLFEIKCSSGTYIRSIVRDMANLLNTVGFMSALIRISSGEFEINNATCLEDLTKENLSSKLISFKQLFEKEIILKDEDFKKITNGVKVQTEILAEPNILVYCQNKLIGLGEIENHILSMKIMLI